MNAILALLILSLLTGMTLHRNACWSDEVSMWSDVVRKAPANPRGLFSLAQGLHRKEANLEEALSLLKKIIELDRQQWFVLSEMGAVYADMGRFSDALVWHERAIAMEPDISDPWDFLGITYVTMGEREKAIGAFERSLAVAGAAGTTHGRSTTHYHLASLYRDVDQARSLYHFEEALRRNPDYYEAMIDLANLHDDLGNSARALPLYRRAIALYPRAPEAYYNLGVFYERHGDRDAARSNYRTAVSFRPDYDEPRKRLEALEQ